VIDGADSNRLGVSPVRHVCTRPDAHSLVCTTRDPARGWVLQSTMTFTAGGMEDTRSNLLKKGVSTVKTYARIGIYQYMA
jgi:hypothetical protein